MTDQYTISTSIASIQSQIADGYAAQIASISGAGSEHIVVADYSIDSKVGFVFYCYEIYEGSGSGVFDQTVRKRDIVAIKGHNLTITMRVAIEIATNNAIAEMQNEIAPSKQIRI